MDRFYHFADRKAKGDVYQHQPSYVTKEEKESSLLVENMTKKDIHVSIFKSLEKLPEELSLLREDYFKKEVRKKNRDSYIKLYCMLEDILQEID